MANDNDPITSGNKQVTGSKLTDRIKQKVFFQVFIIYTRYLIGAAFVFASVIKILGGRFTTISGESEPISSAWHLFETLYQSGLYWKFLGVSQLIAGLLLMTQRYSKLGALAFTGVAANVFVITLSYYFAGTPFITGLMLLACIMLVAWEWDELKVLVNMTPVKNWRNRFEHDRAWELTGLALFLFTVIYRLSVTGYNIMFWAAGCLIITIGGSLFAFSRLKLYKNVSSNEK